LFIKPCQIDLGPGSIQDQQILAIRDSEDVEIVHDPSSLVTHERVLALTHRESLHIIGHDPVQESRGGFAGDDNLAHVRDVEHTRRLTHREMFVHDARVLHRHLPAAKVNQAGTQFLMGMVKGGSLKYHGTPLGGQSIL
jgi:hypothetical protein